MRFSVVISVYHNDKPKFVTRALDSITKEQSIKPDEVVLVVDGPIPQKLRKLIINISQSTPGLYNIIWLPENKGLGNALRVGVDNAKYDVVARMDSDDVAVPSRFEKQINYLNSHPYCDVVGGQITEFIGEESNIIGKRTVVCDSTNIYIDLKYRCPFNHMTVMLKKSTVISVGNYQDWHYNEDYYLWIRLALHGANFANLSDTLVNVRVGKEMYSRRGGWEYFKSEEKLQRYMANNQMISWGGVFN